MTLIPSFKRDLFIADVPYLLVPKALFSFFADLENEHFKLRNGRGSTWDVVVGHCGDKFSGAKLTGEWQKFIDDNYIENDYSLVFFNNEPFMFDVVIYDEKGVARTEYLGRNSENTHAEPRFDLEFTESAIRRGRIAIPSHFWAEEIVPRGKFRLKKALFTGRNNKRWSVDVKMHKDGRHYFTGCQKMFDDLNCQVNEMVRVKL